MSAFIIELLPRRHRKEFIYRKHMRVITSHFRRLFINNILFRGIRIWLFTFRGSEGLRGFLIKALYSRNGRNSFKFKTKNDFHKTRIILNILRENANRRSPVFGSFHEFKKSCSPRPTFIYMYTSSVYYL